MQCTDKIDDSTKSIRGRFIIQEIVDSKSKSSFASTFTIDNIQNNPGDSTKKRRNSLNNSKFKLNSKCSTKNLKEEFLVYDYNLKVFVDIDEIFGKYENTFNPQIIHKFYDTKPRKQTLLLSSSNESKNSSDKENETIGILKKGDVKRIESISNLPIQIINDFKDKQEILSPYPKKKNTLNFFPKKKLCPPSRRFLSMNDKKQILVEQRVFSLMIESSLFNVCSLSECQFTL